MSESSEEKPITGAGTILMICAGIVLAIGGIWKGFQSVGQLCGTVFDPDHLAAQHFDALSGSFGGAVADCTADTLSAAVWVWALIAIGVVLFSVGLIMQAITKSRPTGRGIKNTPGVRQQIEELAALRDQGLVSPEEFDRKKSELLSRI